MYISGTFTLLCCVGDLWIFVIAFFLNFEGHKSFSWGHWYPCFGLLVMSAPSSKARVDPLHTFSPVWSSDLPLLWHLLTEVSMATEPFLPTYLLTCPQALVEVWGSNSRPSVRRAQRSKPLGHSGSAFVIVFIKKYENIKEWRISLCSLSSYCKSLSLVEELL